jgi:AcrR family transcriptional regulator
MATNNPFERREVKSRRGGPVKEPLSRERIVAEALNLLERDGLDGMSLRKVAAGLETSGASLYPYVGDLKGLQSLVLDRALAEVDVCGPRRGDWKARLTSVLRSYITVLLGRPGLAQLAMSDPAVGPNSMRILDTLLALLEEGGLNRATAAWGVDILLLYGNGIALEQSYGHDPTGGGSTIVEAITQASTEDYPHVSASRTELLAGNSSERFSWAINALVTGILQSPVPSARLITITKT